MWSCPCYSSSWALVFRALEMPTWDGAEVGNQGLLSTLLYCLSVSESNPFKLTGGLSTAVYRKPPVRGHGGSRAIAAEKQQVWSIGQFLEFPSDHRITVLDKATGRDWFVQEDQLPSWKSVSLERSLTCRCSEPGSQGHNYLGGRLFVFDFYMISKVRLAHWTGKVCSLIKTAQTSDELLMPSRTWTTDGLVGEGVCYASLDLISRTHIKVEGKQSCHWTYTCTSWCSWTY